MSSLIADQLRLAKAEGRVGRLVDSYLQFGRPPIMKPQTTDSHCSAKPVRYVLEMNQGWFAKRGIKPGYKLSGEPFKSRQP